MRMDDLDYPLPPELIATRPAEPRDSSRLMMVRAGGVQHQRFSDIAECLRAGDLLVVNQTRVLPAKLALRRKSGAAIAGLFLREIAPAQWEAMLRTRGKVTVGEKLLGADYQFELLSRQGEGVWRIAVTPPDPAPLVLQKIGHVPLPPYIERRRKESGGAAEQSQDRAWYQTVFARGAEKSVAAPTAGLHFTPELLAKLHSMGVRQVGVELEVGMGTFLPVETETLEEHPMHVERYHVPAETAAELRAAKRDGRRIVVVGTTAVRTLEAAASMILQPAGAPGDIAGETDLKIAPGYQFQLADVLVTNFHLPRSTLMALVGAFLGEGGIEKLKCLYREAIDTRYRFYSYGDAMIVIP
jgi:S-adenosylmethionine:tRNA ribosyltransferase-isomerase